MRPVVPAWKIHAGPMRLTFSVLIWSSGLYRCPL
ncbi:hypothetical protein SHIRM173S_05549 [Streptomyces hirsutus]